ncbi:MAG: hypothetical protein JW854_16120 [Actinobacteria bacterium]|nr:hypothetical protein [Actinomycetota bacterium]
MRLRKSALLFVLALAAGFVLAVLQPAGPAFAGTWSLEATGGLGGGAANDAALAMALYNSKLYVGTENFATGLEIHSFDGETWVQEVGGGPPGTVTAPGFGNPANVAVISMLVYGSDLYVGTENAAAGCEVWRYDGITWTQVVGQSPPGTPGTGPGFGNAINWYASAMAIYGTDLYVGTFSWGGCELWSFDGAVWTQVVGGLPSALIGPGFGTGCIALWTLQDFGTDLFVGTGAPGGCEVWSLNGITWTAQVSADPTAPLGLGFGNVANTDVMDMAVYGSNIYAGTSNLGGCEVWRYDGINWIQDVGAQPTAIIGPGFGPGGSRDVMQLEVYDSHLFAGTLNNAGCEVWSFNGTTWAQEVGGGAPGTYEAPGFGDTNNKFARGTATFNNRLYLGTGNTNTGCDVFSFSASTTWYLAEGATMGGFETWILVQNPNPNPVNVNLSFQTGVGPVVGPTDTIPANSRRSYLVNTYVNSFDVSTVVSADADVVCERSMYWTPAGAASRRVGHDSIGVVNPASTWYLAEGATAGGFETWVLVQNPNPDPVNVDVKFQTDAGEVQGPQETLAGFSRKSYPVDNYVDTFDVSTRVDSYMGDVVCERAVYFTPDGYPVREVGHESIGVVSPSSTWYLAEGATAGDFETWVLVQNPTSDWVNIDMRFQTGGGEVQGPVDTIAPRSRKSYLVDNWVDTFDVSTSVTSTGGPVICERAMYEAPVVPTRREIGHDSIGTTVGALEWYLAEGATLGGFETWVLVQNPNATPVDIDLRFQTSTGEVAGPVDTIPANSRKSYLVNSWVNTYDVSTKVTSTTGGFIICERAVYWRPAPGAVRYLGTDSIGYSP